MRWNRRLTAVTFGFGVGLGALALGSAHDAASGHTRGTPLTYAAAARTLASAPNVGLRVPADNDGGEPELIRKRDRQFYADRTAGPRGRAPDRSYLRARKQADRLAVQSLVAANSPMSWTELGPHAIGQKAVNWEEWGGVLPMSGRVTAIAPHPTNSSIAYIGTSNGGVWKTIDGGASWKPLMDDQPSMAIGSIAIDRSSPSTVYVGTGESNFGTPSYFGSGVYKTTDGGGSWTQLGASEFANCHISGIQVSPGHSNIILLAAHGAGGNAFDSWSNYCANRNGIWRSLDSGATWTRVLSDGRPTDLAVAPNNGAVWYAAYDGGGIYKSVDYGSTWTQLTSLATTGTRRVDIDVVASTTSPTQVVYAAVAATSGFNGLYESTDGGASFYRLTSPTYGCVSSSGSQCSYDLVVAADPRNPSRAYFGGVWLNRYDSGTPTRVGNYQIHADFHSLAFDADGRIWAGSDGGVNRSSDGGNSWVNLNADLGTILVYPGISGRYSGPIYGGAQDNASFRYTGSRSWTLIGYGDGFFTASAPATSNVAYVELYYLRLEKVINGSNCNIDETSGLTDSNNRSTAPFNAPIAMTPGAPNIMYGGTYRIWKTTNALSTTCGATTWTPVSQGFGQWVSAIAPAQSNTSVVYAATRATSTTASGLYVTTGSTTWTNTAPNGLPNRTLTDIAVSPTNSSVAWVTAAGFQTGHIFATTNRGATWTNISGNLPDAPANAVAVDSRTSPATLYVGTDVGVFWSDDSGANWHNTSVNLPNTIVTDLLLDTSANKMIAATMGRGIWAGSLPGSGGGTGNDGFSGATAVSVLPYSQTGVSNANATLQSGEPQSATCPTMGNTLWWRYTPATSGSVTASTAGSLNGANPLDTVMTVWRGTSLTGLTEVACDDDGNNDGGTAGSTSKKTVAVTAGQTYYFQVGGWRDPTTGTVATGTVNFSLISAGPANDNFAGATIVSSLPYSQSGLSNDSATVETGEPTSNTCTTVGKSLWWRYTPGSSGSIRVDTAGSSYDTVLAIYQGTSLGTLTEVGCDDDAGGQGATSAKTVDVTGGQTYYIQASGWRDPNTGTVASGLLSLSITAAAPANDAFAGATVVDAVPYSSPGVSNVNGSTEAGEPSPTCAPVGKTMWWSYTPGVTTTLTADTAGSGFDTVLGVYTGSAVNALTQVACDDDAGGAGSTSAATLQLNAGQTYYFQVGGWRDTDTTVKTGTITFHLHS